MAAINFVMNDRELRLGLGDLQLAISDRASLLSIAGVLMRASVARTFHDEGSPAGSWARLAASTLKRKGYSAGHKLLILSGRLFGSITYEVEGDTLTVGTGVSYARVQQEGSADRRGAAIGPQAKIAGRGVKVSEYDFARIVPFNQTGTISTRNKSGGFTTKSVKALGAANRKNVHVGEHTRHQNIPPRPFLVIRPEDPQRIVSGWQAFLTGKSTRLGMVGNA